MSPSIVPVQELNENGDETDSGIDIICTKDKHESISLTVPSSKDDLSKGLRLHKILSKNLYLNYLLPGAILIALIITVYLCRNYAKALLYWIENQNPWIIFAVFMFLFVIVSFPVAVGYLILMITSGYLFGFLKGLLTVIFGANIGVFVAHNIIRACKGKFAVKHLLKNEIGRAILRVIAGPRAFKVVLFTRLTPLPFGLQNTIFGVSSVSPRIYYLATLLGLLPAQIINVYLGSTLRSMHDVLNSHNTQLTGYAIFSIQVLIAILLLLWVIQKARIELSEALLSDIGTENDYIIDIES